MTIYQGAEHSLANFLREAYDAPDFSFLQGWPTESSIFPKLNGAPLEDFNLKGEKRVEIAEAIRSVKSIEPLLLETGVEMKSSKGSFSDSISVFHRDGDVSVVAIPVTEATKRSLGGFLLAKELLSNSNADKFVQELGELQLLAAGAERELSRNWWNRKTAERTADVRRSAQLLLAAQTDGPTRISKVVNSLEARIRMTTGIDSPSVKDWQQALVRLEALRDLPEDSVISTIKFSEAEELSVTLELIAVGFHRLDNRKHALKVTLEDLRSEKIKNHAATYMLDDFAKRVKGRGFARKALEDVALYKRDYLKKYRDVDESEIYSGSVSIGEILDLGKTDLYLFRTNSLLSSLKILEEYFEDAKNLLGYPRLTDSGIAFENFLLRAHELHLEQQRPYPMRAQFEVLMKLLKDSPQELHLVGRSAESIGKLIGSVNIYSDVSRRAQLTADPIMSTVSDARDFFEGNPASFQSILSNLGFNALSLDQISGFLAPELTSKIRTIDLDLAGMKSQLRSYQTFGAQYALYQKRTILGDEMGLGKTVTALALATHLINEGAERALVILPLAVLENWRREIIKHTDYLPRVLYGDSLQSDLATWVDYGGIAIATFESIQKVNKHSSISKISSVDLTVVDEAHFIKNPNTKRTRSILPWLRGAGHALLMTGTPLENSLDEFITLISYVQPGLELPSDTLAYTEFRKAIAPVYLRRNQIDVLQEIPEIQDEEEFIELSDADVEYYRRAIRNGDWHQSRRARVLAGEKSSTVQRIQSIVEESVANGHKVLIFSYYLETIEVLRRCLKEDDPYLPLTGALNSVERQAEVDKFSDSREPGVLLAQSSAGGTGLNIQAASVVIIVEPQTKPSLEAQMVARSHRMGQTKAVRVIRLRGKDTLDERWVSMLKEKEQIFAATAGVSDAAALDVAMDNSSTMKAILAEEKRAWA